MREKNSPDEDTKNQKAPVFGAAHRQGEEDSKGTGGLRDREIWQGDPQTASVPSGGQQGRGAGGRETAAEREGGGAQTGENSPGADRDLGTGQGWQRGVERMRGTCEDSGTSRGNPGSRRDLGSR